MSRFVIGFSFALISITATVFAAELFEVPGGVHLRALHQWENNTSVQVETRENHFTVAQKNRTSDHTFKHTQLCLKAAYRTLSTNSTSDWISLEPLCRPDPLSPLKFLFISDTQQYHDKHSATARRIRQLMERERDIRFILNGGDIVQESTPSEWKQYRQIASHYTSKIPLVPVVGNHEYRDDPSLTLYKQVYGHTHTTNHYYELEYGVARLLVLNSNLNELSKAQKKTQTQWLENRLKNDNRSRPTLVTFHHAAYSSGTGVVTMPTNPHYIRTHWQPLFKKYGVSLVLNGHEHVYERLRVDNVPYLVAGPAGGKIGLSFWKHPKSEKLIKKKRTLSVVSIDSAQEIAVRTYDVNGNVTDPPIDRVVY